MANSVSKPFIDALVTTCRKPSLILEKLIDHWPALEKQIYEQREKLSSEIATDDPIRSRVDLLTPTIQQSNERIHTQALAYLFDPAEAHGLGKAALAAVLAKLPHGTGASEFEKFLLQKRTRIHVDAEYHYPIDESSTRSAARCDIWIEMHKKNGEALIVIENKINAPEGKGQLPRYEAEARKWCKEHKGSSLLIYLSRDGRKVDESWLNLSYLDLASALRYVWRRRRSAPGHAWLGLYISAITRGVLGIDIDRLQDTPIKKMGLRGFVWATFRHFRATAVCR